MATVLPVSTDMDTNDAAGDAAFHCVPSGDLAPKTNKQKHNALADSIDKKGRRLKHEKGMTDRGGGALPTPTTDGGIDNPRDLWADDTEHDSANEGPQNSSVTSKSLKTLRTGEQAGT
jgi:hypothetical protein